MWRRKRCIGACRCPGTARWGRAGEERERPPLQGEVSSFERSFGGGSYNLPCGPVNPVRVAGAGSRARSSGDNFASKAFEARLIAKRPNRHLWDTENMRSLQYEGFDGKHAENTPEQNVNQDESLATCLAPQTESEGPGRRRRRWECDETADLFLAPGRLAFHRAVLRPRIARNIKDLLLA